MEKFRIDEKVLNKQIEWKKIDNIFIVKGSEITSNNEKINNCKGVYLFVVKNNFEFNFDEFSSEVTGIFFKKMIPYTMQISVPPFNYYKPSKDKYTMKKDEVFYIGSAGSIRDRIGEHLTSKKITGCTSLKLGIETRSKVKHNLDVYFEENIYRDEEKELRNKYKPYFGK